MVAGALIFLGVGLVVAQALPVSSEIHITCGDAFTVVITSPGSGVSTLKEEIFGCNGKNKVQVNYNSTSRDVLQGVKWLGLTLYFVFLVAYLGQPCKSLMSVLFLAFVSNIGLEILLTFYSVQVELKFSQQDPSLSWLIFLHVQTIIIIALRFGLLLFAFFIVSFGVSQTPSG